MFSFSLHLFIQHQTKLFSPKKLGLGKKSFVQLSVLFLILEFSASVEMEQPPFILNLMKNDRLLGTEIKVEALNVIML